MCVVHHNSLWPRRSAVGLIQSIETELSGAPLSHHQHHHPYAELKHSLRYPGHILYSPTQTGSLTFDVSKIEIRQDLTK